MVFCHPVWKRMRQLTGRKIEKRAVFELVNYIENHMDEIILQSVEELDKLNEMRKIQGVYQKVMIDQYCVQNAIKIINSHSFSFLPEQGGGDNREKKENICKHSQVRDALTEVV